VKFNFPKNIAQHRKVAHGGIFSVIKPDLEILDFSSNISPLGFPPLVRKEILKAIPHLAVYPDSDSGQLRSNLAWYTSLPQSKIIVGNGASEIIYNFCSMVLRPRQKVLIAVPTFGEYEAAAKLNDCNVSFFKTMNLSNNYKDFIKKIPKNGCIFLCNPNNPTGVLIPKIIMKQIIIAARKKSTIVFVDESFIELVQDPSQSLVTELKNENLFVLRSLTKSFGLAGIRIGYGLGHKKIIDILDKTKIPWNVSGLAQKAAGAALCHSFYLDKSRKLIKKESLYLKNSISKISGYTIFDSATNFFLIKCKKNSKTIQKKLLKKKLLIRDCSSFRGLDNHYIRIAVKKRKENIKLVKALEKV